MAIGVDITYHQLLTLFETPQEGSKSANIHSVGQNGHQVVENSGNLAEHGSDPLCSLRYLDVEELLDGKGEDLLVGHHGNIVQTIKVWECLEVGLVFNQLLGTAVQETDVGVCTDNLFTIELENETQDTVSGRVLRSEVDSVVSDLALGRVCRIVAGRVQSLVGRINRGTEVWVDLDEASGIRVLDWCGKVSRV